MADFSWVPKELEGQIFYKDKHLVVACAVCEAPRITSGKGAVLRHIEKGLIENLKYCGIHGTYVGRKFPQSDIDSWPEGHKRCTVCKEIKPFDEYHKHKTAMFGYNTVCKLCRIPDTKRKYHNLSWESRLFYRAKSRAKLNGREFSIAIDDIRIPEKCPILGVKLVLDAGSDYVPSLDRKNSDLGYTPDNIEVVSRRANVLKNNMSVQEARLVYEYLIRETA